MSKTRHKTEALKECPFVVPRFIHLNDARFLMEHFPCIPAQALRTLSGLDQECVAEQLDNLVTKGLDDDNAYVRRVAIVTLTRLHQQSPAWVKDTGKVDVLYGKIRDPDPIVVSTALQV